MVSFKNSFCIIFLMAIISFPSLSAGKNYRCAKERAELSRIYRDMSLPIKYIDMMASKIHDGLLKFNDQMPDMRWDVESLKNIICSGLIFELDHEQLAFLYEDLDAICEIFTTCSIGQIVSLNEELVRVEAARIIMEYDQQKIQKKLEKNAKIRARRDGKLCLNME